MNKKIIPLLYEKKSECCGCTACYAICPQVAIRMLEDEEGFEYPQVDGEKCIRCYQCLKVCPIKKEKERKSLHSALKTKGVCPHKGRVKFLKVF